MIYADLPVGVLSGGAMTKLVTLVVLGIVLAFASRATTRWGGSCGYNQLEYELTFKDPSGNPIEGVELNVEDERGNQFFCFPVTDYLPNRTPKYDEQGVMRFHHVATAVEWDNHGWLLFWTIPVQTTRSPNPDCAPRVLKKEPPGLCK